MASLTLRSGQLSLIGVLWQGERNSLSPLLPYGNTEEREDGKKILKGCGALDSNGDIDKRYYPVLDFLQNPAGMVLFNRITVSETKTAAIYNGVNKGSVVVFSDDTDSVTLVEEPAISEILSTVNVDEGTSNNDVNTIDTSISLDEMRTLAVIYDAERRSVFDAIDQAASDSDFTITPLVHTADSVRTLFSSFNDDMVNSLFLWIFSGMEPIAPSGILPNPASILQGLEAKGLLQKSGTGYVVPDPQLPMVRRTIIIDTVISVNIKRIADNGATVSESTVCIRADGTLLWFIIPKDNSGLVLLKYISSDTENRIFHELTGNPLYFLKQIKVPPLSEKVPKKKFCTQCGAQLSPGAKFCKKCGVKIS
jgi:ribosomal protein L40E